jgi:hypothetical protein
MKETPTPETDAACFPMNAKHPYVSTDFARKLERERDEARTELEMWRDGNIMHQIHRDELEKAERERDKWAKLCGQYKQERDEAREAARRYLTELKNNGH